MSSWQTWLLILAISVLFAGISWFVSADIARDKAVAEFAQAPKDTVYAVDTLWRERVRVERIERVRVDTFFVHVQAVDTLFVAAADSSTDRFRLHVEYCQPAPLDPRGVFQNIRVSVKDSVRTVTVTQTVVDVRTEFPLWQTIAIGSAAFGLGVWFGSR